MYKRQHLKRFYRLFSRKTFILCHTQIESLSITVKPRHSNRLISLLIRSEQQRRKHTMFNTGVSRKSWGLMLSDAGSVMMARATARNPRRRVWPEVVAQPHQIRPIFPASFPYTAQKIPDQWVRTAYLGLLPHNTLWNPQECPLRFAPSLLLYHHLNA